MKENEEITNLERFELLIEDCKGHRELYGEFSVGEYDIEIMQNILSDYKRVLKENKELKRLHIQDNKHLDFIMEHSIPIQKIKDKIEEIKNIANELSQEIEEELKSEDICREYIREKKRELGLANRDIKLLQELLEERK